MPPKARIRMPPSVAARSPRPLPQDRVSPAGPSRATAPAPAALSAVPPSKAQKVDPFAHLPIYDYKTFPEGLSDADQPTLLLLSDPRLVDEAIGYLNSPVGLDIEWAPTFVKGAPIKPTSLLQVSDGSTILLIQTLGMLKACPPALKAFLEDPSVIKLGVGILPDSAKLSNDLGIACKGCFDLNSLKPEPTTKVPTSLAKLTGEYTGRRLHKSKGVTMSNWAVSKLSPSQIAYAANDVQSAVHVYSRLHALAAASSFASHPAHPSTWSWTAPGASPHPSPDPNARRVPAELAQRAQAAPPAMDFSKSGFIPPGFSTPPRDEGKPAKKKPKEDVTAWWPSAVAQFRQGKSIQAVIAAVPHPTTGPRPPMDVRWAIANHLSRAGQSLTAEEGRRLTAGVAYSEKGRFALQKTVYDLVHRGAA